MEHLDDVHFTGCKGSDDVAANSRSVVSNNTRMVGQCVCSRSSFDRATRIVSRDFDIAGWLPDKAEIIHSILASAPICSMYCRLRSRRIADGMSEASNGCRRIHLSQQDG